MQRGEKHLQQSGEGEGGGQDWGGQHEICRISKKEMGTTGSREGIWKALEPLYNQEGWSERLPGHNNQGNQLKAGV